jgi:pimeloyl-ACP methyl ester carboxylesterase
VTSHRTPKEAVAFNRKSLYVVVNDATFASLGDGDFLAMLARLRQPALVVEGEQSITTVESARAWAAAMECDPAQPRAIFQRPRMRAQLCFCAPAAVEGKIVSL